MNNTKFIFSSLLLLSNLACSSGVFQRDHSSTSPDKYSRQLELTRLETSARFKAFDIPYCDSKLETDQELQTLDILAPDAPDEPLPVLLFIHGGAFIAGDKSDFTRDLEGLITSQQIVVANINYRLANGRITFQDQMADVASALAYVAAHVSDYGGDPSNIFLGGGSAGASLASVLAFSLNELLPLPWDENRCNQGELPNISGLINNWGIYTDDAYFVGDVPFLGTNLVRFIHGPQGETAPSGYGDATWGEVFFAQFWADQNDRFPVLINHGTKDELVGFKNAEYFWLERHSVQPVEMYHFPSASHGLINLKSPHINAGLDHAAQFINSSDDFEVKNPSICSIKYLGKKTNRLDNEAADVCLR